MPMAKITKTIDLKQLAKKVPIVLISVGISWLILYLLRDMLRSSFLSPIETKKIVAEKEIVGTNSKVAALKRSGGRKNEETKKSRNNDMNDREDVEVIGAGSKGNLSGDAKEGSARNKHMSSVALSASDCASQKEYCALRQFLSEKQDRAVYIYVHVAENEICGKWKEGSPINIQIDDAARLKKYYEGLVKTHKRLNKKVMTGAKVQNYAEIKQNLDRLEHEIKAFQDAYGSFIKAQNNNFGEFSEEMYRTAHFQPRQNADIPNYGNFNVQDRAGQPFPPKTNTEENSEGLIGAPIEEKMDFSCDPSIKYDPSSFDFQTMPFMYGSSAPLLYNTCKGFPKTITPRSNMNYQPNYAPPMASPAMFEQSVARMPSKSEYSPMLGAYTSGIKRPNFSLNPQPTNPVIPQNYSLGAYPTKSPYPGYRPNIKSVMQAPKSYQPPSLGFKNTAQKTVEPMYAPYQYSPVIGNNSLLQPKRADYHRNMKVDISPTLISTTPSQPASGEGSMTPTGEASSVYKAVDPHFLLAGHRIPNADEMCVNAKKFRTSEWSTNIEYFMKRWNLKFELTDAVKNQILDSCDHFFAQLCKKSINLAKGSADRAVKRMHIEYAFYELENYLLPDSSLVMKNRTPNKKRMAVHHGHGSK